MISFRQGNGELNASALHILIVFLETTRTLNSWQRINHASEMRVQTGSVPMWASYRTNGLHRLKHDLAADSSNTCLRHSSNTGIYQSARDMLRLSQNARKKSDIHLFHPHEIKRLYFWKHLHNLVHSYASASQYLVTFRHSLRFLN